MKSLYLIALGAALTAALPLSDSKGGAPCRHPKCGNSSSEDPPTAPKPHHLPEDICLPMGSDCLPGGHHQFPPPRIPNHPPKIPCGEPGSGCPPEGLPVLPPPRIPIPVWPGEPKRGGHDLPPNIMPPPPPKVMKRWPPICDVTKIIQWIKENPEESARGIPFIPGTHCLNLPLDPDGPGSDPNKPPSQELEQRDTTVQDGPPEELSPFLLDPNEHSPWMYEPYCDRYELVDWAHGIDVPWKDKACLIPPGEYFPENPEKGKFGHTIWPGDKLSDIWEEGTKSSPEELSPFLLNPDDHSPWHDEPICDVYEVEHWEEGFDVPWEGNPCIIAPGEYGPGIKAYKMWPGMKANVATEPSRLFARSPDEVSDEAKRVMECRRENQLHFRPLDFGCFPGVGLE